MSFTNLTGLQLSATFGSVMHFDNNGGVSASLQTIYDGLGNACGFSVSSSGIQTGNLSLTGNAITTTSGNISLGSTGGTTTFGDSTFVISNSTAFRAGIGTVIGTDVQAYSAKLLALASQTWAADTISYQTSASAVSTTALTTTARSLLDDTSTSAMRTTLGVAIGSDVQAYNARLADVAGLTPTDNGVIIGDGVNFVVESGATLKTSLGLTIGTNVQAYDAELAAIAGLTSAADKVPYFTGSGTAATADLTSAARTVLDDTTVAAMVDTLGGASASGSGGLARVTSATFVTPLLGTPTSGTLTNCTGYTGVNLVLTDVTTNNATSAQHGFLPKLSNDAGQYLNGQGGWTTPSGAGDALTTQPLSQFAATTSLQLKNTISDETGSGLLVFATSPTLTTPILGTPTSGTLTNCTLPVGGVTGLGTGVSTFLATPSSANLAAALTDETGSGSAVFGTAGWTTFSPTVTLVGGSGNTVPVYTTNTGRYCQIGNVVHVIVKLQGDGGAEGAGTGTLTIAMPVSIVTAVFQVAGYMQNSIVESIVFAQKSSSTTISLYRFSTISTTAIVTGADQNNTSREIELCFFYEA